MPNSSSHYDSSSAPWQHFIKAAKVDGSCLCLELRYFVPPHIFCIKYTFFKNIALKDYLCWLLSFLTPSYILCPRQVSHLPHPRFSPDGPFKVRADHCELLLGDGCHCRWLGLRSQNCLAPVPLFFLSLEAEPRAFSQSLKCSFPGRTVVQTTFSALKATGRGRKPTADSPLTDKHDTATDSAGAPGTLALQLRGKEREGLSNSGGPKGGSPTALPGVGVPRKVLRQQEPTLSPTPPATCGGWNQRLFGLWFPGYSEEPDVYWMEAVEEVFQQRHYLYFLFEASAGCLVSRGRPLVCGRIGRGFATALSLAGRVCVLAPTEGPRALGSSLLGSE